MDCSPPGSSVHGISQARMLEWVAISFSRGSSWPWDRNWVSHIADRFHTTWATREAPIWPHTPFLFLISLVMWQPSYYFLTISIMFYHIFLEIYCICSFLLKITLSHLNKVCRLKSIFPYQLSNRKTAIFFKASVTTVKISTAPWPWTPHHSTVRLGIWPDTGLVSLVFWNLLFCCGVKN